MFNETVLLAKNYRILIFLCNLGTPPQSPLSDYMYWENNIIHQAQLQPIALKVSFNTLIGHELLATKKASYFIQCVAFRRIRIHW